MSEEEDEKVEGMVAIDWLYEILELLEKDIEDLERAKRARVAVYRYQGILEAVELLDQLDFSNRLGISAMDLDKFRRTSGTIDNAVLRQLARRLKSLLREAEGTIRSIATPPASLGHTTTADATPVQNVVAIEWVQNDRSKNSELIANLSELLNEAVERARGTNLAPGKAALTEFQRKTLINLLETAVLMLQGPLVEKGLLKKLGDAAGEGATGAVKKGAEMGLGAALKSVWELVTQLLARL
jgi:hypothetical protein